jgi:glycosyltransferase involved in cell wall biosynthesis
MRISLLIVVPTLNSHDLLPCLVTSLQEQSWPHWRLLFIDGPSGLQHRQWLDFCCDLDTRCRWVAQDPNEPGIFGAMNQGFAAALDPACPADWLLFWGSDDWAASTTVLEEAILALKGIDSSCGPSSEYLPDLLVCTGRYVDVSTGILGRPTAFKTHGRLTSAAYRRRLLLGLTPPHQATLIGPGARARLAGYAKGFRLSADLDYFLQLSVFNDLSVQVLDLELVHMSSGGISGQQTWRRLREVFRAYQRVFGCFWWFPFLARYVRRVFSFLDARR